MGTRFTDGPAAGVDLLLSRAPIFLRVTHDPAQQKWDALDQLGDEAFDGEKIFCYRLIGNHGFCHVDGRDKKTGKRFGKNYVLAEYVFYENQPPESILRDNAQWQAWVLETIDLEGPQK